MVPVTIDGKQVRLAVITHKPPGDGPFPTLVFHHGSTGTGKDPSSFARPYDPVALAQWFTSRGWAVLLPSRRGRGGSEGQYDEGFGIDRAQGYSCEPTWSLPGAERALRDIDAITPVLLAQPFVDRNRFVVGGQSRGGVLTVAWAGRHPEMPRAAINFVGGWMGEGCSNAREINQTLFKKGAVYPQPIVWLYGDRDPFYSLGHSRANFAAFEAAGGKGSFHEFAPPTGVIGHLISNFPALWGDTVAGYLEERGL